MGQKLDAAIAERDRAREDIENLQCDYAGMVKQRNYFISATKEARAKCDELQEDKDDLLNKLKRAELKNDSLQERLLAKGNTQRQHTAGDCVPRTEHEALRLDAKCWAEAYRRLADSAKKARIKQDRTERKHAASKRKHKGAEARAHKLTEELNTLLHTLETERSNLLETAAQRDRYREHLAKAKREATETGTSGRKRAVLRATYTLDLGTGEVDALEDETLLLID